MTDFITFELLGTWAVCIGVTTLLTQFIKRYLPKIDPQIISCVLAVVLLEMSNGFTKGWSFEGILLTLINGVILGLSCNGVYDAFAKAGKDKSGE